MTRRSVVLCVTLAATSQLASGCGYCCRPFLWRGCGGCCPQFYQPGPGPLSGPVASPSFAPPVIGSPPGGCATCASSYAGGGPVIASTGPTGPGGFAGPIGGPALPPGIPVYTGTPITFGAPPPGYKPGEAPNPMPTTGGMK